MSALPEPEKEKCASDKAHSKIAADNDVNVNYPNSGYDSTFSSEIKEIEFTGNDIVKLTNRVRFDTDDCRWCPLLDVNGAQLDAVPIGGVYDSNRGKYWITTNEDNWICVSEKALQRHLAQDFHTPKENQEAVINAITRGADVEFATSLAGYRKGVYQFGGRRVLVSTSPNVIVSRAGDFPIIYALLVEMLGAIQYDYFIGWLKVAYEALSSGNFIPGQVLVLVGQPNTYKTFAQENIITPILGGRTAEPLQFMTGQTSFNSDLFKAEHLMISDEVPSTDYEDRKRFASAIKKLTFNETQRMHAKGRDAIDLKPLWRISMSLNPEDIEILPPIEDGLTDKVMLFAVNDPISIKDQFEGKRDEFGQKIRTELPAFVNFLVNWKIPAELKVDRTTIKSYFNPEVAGNVEDTSPEAAFVSLMEKSLVGASESEYTSGDLFTRMMSDPNLKQSVMKLTDSPVKMGRMLAKIGRKSEYKSFVQSKGHGRAGTVWKITRRFKNCDRE
jgi:hypothetical protein